MPAPAPALQRRVLASSWEDDVMKKAEMKAVRQHAFGGPGVLRYEDAPLPILETGELLVRVCAVGVNPPDWYLREGYKALPPEWRARRWRFLLSWELTSQASWRRSPRMFKASRSATTRVAIDSVFSLAEAREAHERAARGHMRGKIVLTTEPSSSDRSGRERAEQPDE
jgi:NADPH:quinone reductase-like Zn-dependent oxidoreductase